MRQDQKIQGGASPRSVKMYVVQEVRVIANVLEQVVAESFVRKMTVHCQINPGLKKASRNGVREVLV